MRCSLKRLKKVKLKGCYKSRLTYEGMSWKRGMEVVGLVFGERRLENGSGKMKTSSGR